LDYAEESMDALGRDDIGTTLGDVPVCQRIQGNKMNPIDTAKLKEIDDRFNREQKASRAKINRNRQWYRLMTRCADAAYTAISLELKKESDQTLIFAFREMDNLEPLNAWWFLHQIKPHIGSVIYNELAERGYINVWRDGAPTKEWEKK
jgi:hypothetical protein